MKIFVKRHGLKEGSISTIGSYLDSTIQDFCAANLDAREMTDSFGTLGVVWYGRFLIYISQILLNLTHR
jgi:hypothetical protein